MIHQCWEERSKNQLNASTALKNGGHYQDMGPKPPSDLLLELLSSQARLLERLRHWLKVLKTGAGCSPSHRGFHKWGTSNSIYGWLIHHEKSHLEVDDFGVPLFQETPKWNYPWTHHWLVWFRRGVVSISTFDVIHNLMSSRFRLQQQQMFMLIRSGQIRIIH